MHAMVPGIGLQQAAFHQYSHHSGHHLALAHRQASCPHAASPNSWQPRHIHLAQMPVSMVVTAGSACLRLVQLWVPRPSASAAYRRRKPAARSSAAFQQPTAVEASAVGSAAAPANSSSPEPAAKCAMPVPPGHSTPAAAAPIKHPCSSGQGSPPSLPGPHSPDPAPHQSQGGLRARRLASVGRSSAGQDAGGGQALRPVSRHRLNRMDLAEYAGETLFHAVARQVCLLDGVIPRKELHETWEAAVRIQAMFPHKLRVADLASGNGLLSWILLLVDASGARTVICVDRTKPHSAGLITSAFLDTWPHLQARHQYVEDDLCRLQAQPDALLVSMHGCGGLTDQVIRMAVSVGAALAVVPCCHSLRGSRAAPLIPQPSDREHASAQRPGAMQPGGAWTREGSRRDKGGLGRLVEGHPRGQGAEAHVRRMAARFGVAAAVDAARVASLRRRGYSVRIDHLPEDITPKNRMILALNAAAATQERPPCAGGAEQDSGLLWPAPPLPESPWTRFKLLRPCDC